MSFTKLQPQQDQPKNSALVKPVFFQPKLIVNQPNDIYEQEADTMADQVMDMPDKSVNSNAFFKPADNKVQRKCQHCEEEEKLHRKESSDGEVQGSNELDSYAGSLGSLGQSLPNSSRQFFESRFGHDFSNVRIHNDSVAAKSAQSINALAYTSGNNIVFNQGQYSPESESSKKLMAHELTHVVQQSGNIQPKLIQRKGFVDTVADVAACVIMITEIKGSPVYAALSATDKALADDIIIQIGKRPLNEQKNYYLPSLKTLFVTVVKPPAQISVETQQSTVVEAQKEQVRLKKPAQAKNTNIEEKAAADPARKGSWTRVKGKFGGGYFYIDKRSATDIVVRANIMIKPTGTGTAADVTHIKSMEDAIEKAASNKGYLVDITFVDVADADTFTVEVDPSRWEVATNWAGGTPRDFAHELHHMLAFEIDKYNYIDNQSLNDSMTVGNRLIWFRKELDKPPGYNDPTSIMDQAPHPNDSDVCTVAGLDMKACMDARKKMAPH